MRFIWWLVLAHLIGCSTAPPAPEVVAEEDTVSVAAALDHIRQSYILGCVEALHAQAKQNVYTECRNKGIRHGDAVRKFLEDPGEVQK